MKKTFPTHSGTPAPVCSQPLQGLGATLSGLAGGLVLRSDTVLRYIQDVDLRRKVVLTCPDCGSKDWRYFSFQNDKVVVDPDDVGHIVVRCCAYWVMRTQSCNWESELYELMDPPDHYKLHQDVVSWMAKAGINNAAASMNSFPSPYATPQPLMKGYKVLLTYKGRQFECHLVVTIPQSKQSLDSRELSSRATAHFMPTIHAYVDRNSPLESNVREIPVQFKSITGGFIYESLDAAGKPKSETDKPGGTRDVEKFLREQQNKLWGDGG